MAINEIQFDFMFDKLTIDAVLILRRLQKSIVLKEKVVSFIDLTNNISQTDRKPMNDSKYVVMLADFRMRKITQAA